jgi:lipopolysaccharide biosynthesis glycosyltransferase
MDDAHIVFAINNKYTMPLGVLIYSILVNNANEFNTVNFYICYLEKLTEENKNILLKQANEFNSAKVFFIDMNKFFRKIIHKKNILVQKETFMSAMLQFFIDKIVPKNVDRAVNFDVDMVCEGSFKELFTIDMGENVIGAVDGGGDAKSKENFLLKKDMNILLGGMFLYNLPIWRKNS